MRLHTHILRNGTIMAFLLLMAGVTALAYAATLTGDASGADTVLEKQATAYIGAQACQSCHAEAYDAWQGSHHDLAMQEVSDKTVLGSFDNAIFLYNGIESRFFKRDGQFFVNTDGPDGTLADFAIQYTFGVTPLQQYLIKLPGGRLQALSIAWDSRNKTEGGQRWFHLYPAEKVTHEDVLHWTRRSQNWNHMCAECHSTDYQKNFQAGTQTYDSNYAALNVSCEACHGPGELHQSWAKQQPGGPVLPSKGLVLPLDERLNVSWPIDALTGNAKRTAPRTSNKELEMCARCHSRRGQVSSDYRHGALLMETHLPALLREGLYHADGQIQDEVYEYGSFLQSKMHQQGVSCSDCHEPHTLQLRAPGNGVCLQCHAATRFESPAHHFHPQASAGLACVDCHMPGKLYMGVDFRRDHSFRVPRPDLSAKLGTPDACTGCHQDKSADWAADSVRQWLGRNAGGLQNFAVPLYAARTATVDAEAALVALLDDDNQPAIARGTAAAELAQWMSQETLSTLYVTLRDPDPLVRLGALEALEALPADLRWQMGRELLQDPVRAIRLRSAGIFAYVPRQQMSTAEQEQFDAALKDYLAEQRLNADIPESHANLGNLYLAQGKFSEAEKAIRQALALDAHWVPAWVNLAELLHRTGRDHEAEPILQAGLQKVPDAAALHHSLGLLRIRQKKLPEALDSLQQAATLAPENARFSYVYAVALHSVGKQEGARKILADALKRAPANRELNALQESWR